MTLLKAVAAWCFAAALLLSIKEEGFILAIFLEQVVSSSSHWGMLVWVLGWGFKRVNQWFGFVWLVTRALHTRIWGWHLTSSLRCIFCADAF